MIRGKIVLCVWLACGGAAHLRAGVVANVRAAQRLGTEFVDIYYDLGGQSIPDAISLEVSADGGVTYTVPVVSLVGDVGTNVLPGVGRHILWDAGADWDGQQCPTAVFRVTAEAPDAEPEPDGMSTIPSGEFLMGDIYGDGDPSQSAATEAPHRVYVSAFHSDTLEVSVGMLYGVMTWGYDHGYAYGFQDLWQRDQKATSVGTPYEFPAGNITWYECLIWCNARSEMAALTPCYLLDGQVYRRQGGAYGDNVVCDWTADGYRLPTEAEWEKAARGGVAAKRFPWGNRISHANTTYWSVWEPEWGPEHPVYPYDVNLDVGPHRDWVQGLYPWTAPCGTFPRNGYKLHEVSGNVAEWCWDVFSSAYYTNCPWADPTGPAGPADGQGRRGVTRGGGAHDSAYFCRLAARNPTYATLYDLKVGFRCVRRTQSEGDSFAQSRDVVIDTSGGPVDPNPAVTITGRVRDARRGFGLVGARAVIHGRSCIAGEGGAFSIANIDLRIDNELLVQRTGYLDQRLTVERHDKERSVDVGDVWLAQTQSKPVIESLTPDLAGILVPGFGLVVTANAKVNWNGNTPGAVYFYANGEPVGSESGEGPVYSHRLPVDSVFSAAFGIGRNTVEAIANSAGGQLSDARKLDIVVIPLPVPLAGFVLDRNNISTNNHRLELEITFPNPELAKKVKLPVVGEFGAEFQMKAVFAYSYVTGAWELTWGVGGGTAEVVIGDLKLGTSLEGSGSGIATVDQGIKLEKLLIRGGLALANDFELGQVGALDILGPGLSTTLAKFPGVEKVVKAVSLTFTLKPSLAGTLEGGIIPKFEFKSLTFGGTLALEASYEPTVGFADVDLYAGGEPRVTFQIPGDLFKEVGFKLYAGINVTRWGLSSSLKYVFIDYTYPVSGKRLPLAGLHDIGTGYLLEAAGNRTADWRPVERTWRDNGPETFLAAPSARRGPDDAQATFAAMGRTPSPGAIVAPGTRQLPSRPALPAQAELPLIGNAYPGARPALASHGADLMLLYTRDTGGTNPVQFTELNWTRFDGATWSTPNRVAAGAGSTLYAEGFNDTDAPTGWSVEQNGELNADFITASEHPSVFTPTEGARMVRVNCYSVDGGSLRLRQITPVSSVGWPAGTSAQFDWTIDGEYPVSNDRVSLEWSTDGSDWHSLGEVSRYMPATQAWTTPAFELPSGALNQPAVYFSFLVTSEYGNDCHLDNFRIAAEVSASTQGAQFAPAVAYDGNGDAVAVWEQVRDPEFDGTGLNELAAQMEIMSARWDAAAGGWTEPEALTDNDYLDQMPLLAGPLQNGDLILTWCANASNLLMGTGLPGSPANSRIMTRRWDSAAGAWTPAATLIPDLTGELSIAAAGGGNSAVLALIRDMDADLDTTNDVELFYKTWDVAAGTWGALTRHTADAVRDGSVRLAVSEAGVAYCVWLRGDDLVMDVDFSGSPTIVRTNATSLGLADVTVTVGPAGNLVALWQEMSPDGPDAYYRVYDPATHAWGLDERLSHDAELESCFATTWDPMANLVVAYKNVTIAKQTVTVPLEGGGTIDVQGVPQPGQMDLLLAKRALVKDLAIAEGLTAGADDYVPGAMATFTARVANAGDVAVEDIEVSFYDGDPDAGGTAIGNATVPGWLRAGDHVDVSITWTVPSPAARRTVYAVVDPDDRVTEYDEANNSAWLTLGGVDMDLQYLSGEVTRDGSVSLVAQVRNLTGPDSPVVLLALMPATGSVVLVETAIPQLGPGESVDVPLALPAASQAEGTALYRLVLDERNHAEDRVLSNNEAIFALTLWIDDDQDGIPASWERDHGMSDDDPDDAGLDVDHDGFNARQEFLAGTNPDDGNSYLKTGEISVTRSAGGTSNTCTVSWSSATGRVYKLERSFDLDMWTTVRDGIMAMPPLNTVEDEQTPVPAKVYYRVKAR